MARTDISATASAIRWSGMCLTPNSFCRRLTMNTFEPQQLYAGYAYAYPHKTAYRALDPPVALSAAWAAERRDALFLYLHAPFCEMRCGFCNLFTTANPPASFAQDYLTALRRQAWRMREAVGAAQFSRLAIGGG